MLKKNHTNNILIIFSALLLLNSCSISGHYQSSGPCQGFHKDQQACLAAAANSRVIGNVDLGQTLKEVRQIMGKGPERREADDDSESWSYLTSYRGSHYTTITFKNGVVTEIR